MLYNSNITYSQAGILYQGSLRISVSGISSPILINNIRIIIDPLDDYSNNTSIGIVSYNLNPSGIMSFETTDFQAEAITTSEVITLNSVSGEVTIQSI
jgi:hypothetical protein